MVMAVITYDKSTKRPLKQLLYYRVVKFGLPEVDKLFEEFREIRDTISNAAGKRIMDDGDNVDEIAEAQKIKNPQGNSIDVNKDFEDRISRLPSDILQFIISLLTMREGAATSILSTRWRDLWSTSVSCLSFDDLNLLGYKYPPDIYGEKEKFQESQKTKFIRRADHICQTCRASKMDTLQVSFLLYEDSAGHIDRWMELAAAQRVTKLILDFGMSSRFNVIFPGGKKYKFPVQRFGSSLNYLYIKSCILEFPLNHGLNSLVSLKLSQCLLTSNDVQNILSNCPLQWLSLRACDFPDPTILKFVGPSIRLKHLHIADPYNDNIKEILVQDVNLISFELDMDEPKLSIENVPHLARLMLQTGGQVEILGNLPLLETLFIDHKESELPKLSAFNNLKQLVFAVDSLRSNLFEVVCFLEACPSLQQLELNMHRLSTIHDEEELSEIEGLSSKIGSRVGCSHHNLKEVHIHGFDSHPEIIELAKYLLANATVLEKMIMSSKSKAYCANGLCLISEASVNLVGMSLENVVKLFREEARPTTEILIV